MNVRDHQDFCGAHPLGQPVQWFTDQLSSTEIKANQTSETGLAGRIPHRKTWISGKEEEKNAG